MKYGKWLLLPLVAVVAVGLVYRDDLGLGGSATSATSAASEPKVIGTASPKSPTSAAPTTPSASPPATANGSPAMEEEEPSPDDVPAVPAWAADNLPSQTIKMEDAVAVVTNPSSLYVLVNKQRNLPADYSPPDLVVPDVPFAFSGDSPKKMLRKEAAEALEQLVAAAREDGIVLKAVSGYRSYATQKSLFDSYARKDGIEAANRYSAFPGQSEHQTGLTMDISGESVQYKLTADLGKAKEGIWLAEHAAEFGFIIRYPEGMEAITGYTYEPWHLRYIGVEAAEAVAASGLTLEQFFETLEVGQSRS